MADCPAAVSSPGTVPAYRSVPIPGSVLLGSTGRNTGKTEFACDLIRSLSQRCPVFAVKVTTIKGGPATCVHGTKGCGVCAAMEGTCILTQELDPGTGKDTSRMLAAGAQRVWWLRVIDTALDEGVEELTRLVPRGGILVVESNSIRLACEPDIFFMLGNPDRPNVKESARAVLSEVDRFVGFDGLTFDFDPGSLAMASGRINFPRDASAIILAGGRSSRMGRDKRLLEVDGRPLLTHVFRQIAGSFSEVLFSVARFGDIDTAGTRQVPDRFGDIGPIGGVATALAESRHQINFVTACDTPQIPLRFVHTMLRRARDHQVVVPVHPDGRHEPLFAVYRQDVLTDLHRLVGRGERKVRLLFDHVDTLRIPVPSDVDLRNLNTLADYDAFRAGTPAKN